MCKIGSPLLSFLLCSLCTPLQDFANENLVGKTVTFIPTAALPDKLDFHIKYSKELLVRMGLIVDELEISTATNLEIINKLENNDYIYVAGGNLSFCFKK